MVKLTQRENSSGYYYGLPKVGRALFTRHFYDQDTRPLLDGASCIPHNPYSPQIGGGLQGLQGLQGLMQFLAPMGNESLMTLVVLLVLEHFNKYDEKKLRGGYLEHAQTIMTPMTKETLIVIAALLLLHYYTHPKTMSGGDSKFTEKLIEILKKKYKMRGGAILENIGQIIAPLGTNPFVATTLLVLLDRLFRGKKIMTGGGNDLFSVIHQLLNKNNKMKGGDCGCMEGGSNPLEVVGDKPLNYNKDLQQFGCKVQSWGANLPESPKCI